MTVYGMDMLYGIKLDAPTIRILVNAGIFEWCDVPTSSNDEGSTQGDNEPIGEKLLERFDYDERHEIYSNELLISTTSWEIVITPHDARSDYDESELYYGVHDRVYFGQYSALPTLSMDECRSFDQMLAKYLPGVTAKYELIPTDCNCCS